MEGRLGMFTLIAKLMNNETFDILNISDEDFGISWYNISISSNGIINQDTGKPIFPTNENSSSTNETNEMNESNTENKNNETKNDTKKNVKKESFPIGGVEKKDYRVWSDSLQRNVKAEYVGERVFRGKVVYLYRTSAENELCRVLGCLAWVRAVRQAAKVIMECLVLMQRCFTMKIMCIG
jgi:hypothetical protein